ncbi:hypothetical protein EV363DRAFT_1438452 [Boletus edulis]|nr:hypothetical protein EV363DRAFT_1438452 [Boletus edulis]
MITECLRSSIAWGRELNRLHKHVTRPGRASCEPKQDLPDIQRRRGRGLHAGILTCSSTSWIFHLFGVITITDRHDITYFPIVFSPRYLVQVAEQDRNYCLSAVHGSFTNAIVASADQSAIGLGFD